MSTHGAPPPTLAPLDAPDGISRLAALRAFLGADLAALAPEARDDAAHRLALALASDPAPLVRRSALLALASLAPPPWPLMLAAFSDPVWRVRITAVRLLARIGQGDPGLRRQALALASGGCPRTEGARAALAAAWGEPVDPPPPAPLWGGLARSLPCWDDDPAALLARLRRADLAACDPAALLSLLLLDDSRLTHDIFQEIRALVVDTFLAADGAHDAAFLPLLDDPRHPFLLSWVADFLARLPAPRRAALQAASQGAPGLAGRWARGEGLPALGASYFSLARDLSPAPTARRGEGEGQSVTTARGGGWGGEVLVLSGRYGLPARGYERAWGEGVRSFFWEPSYGLLGEFLATRGASERDEAVVVAGTFEASSRGVRRDVERALRLLRREQIPVFLLFWARSSARLSDEALGEMARLRGAGKVGAWGVSTHDRAVGVEAIARGAEVVMARYSAAHRGAEAALLPAARGRARVLAFTCLCYGKLLEATPAGPPPTALDLYRFALSHPAVSACVTAPRDEAELGASLGLLGATPLDEERLAWMRRHGEEVYRRSRSFFDLIRSR